MVNQQFLDLVQLSDKVRQIKSFKIEKEYIRKGVKKERVAYVDYIDSVEIDEEEEDQESFMAVVELQGRPPYLCLSLRLARGKEKTSSNYKTYAFDIKKVDQIFDILLRNKQLKLPKGHKMPSIEEIGNKRYCKYHYKFFI